MRTATIEEAASDLLVQLKDKFPTLLGALVDGCYIRVYIRAFTLGSELPAMHMGYPILLGLAQHFIPVSEARACPGEEGVDL